MGYDFIIKNAMRVREDKEYPWPCETEPNRTIILFTDDVLTVDTTGLVMKHTGLGCFGIKVPHDDLVQLGEKKLRLL